jgi:hypothetical protein
MRISHSCAEEGMGEGREKDMCVTVAERGVSFRYNIPAYG